MRDQWGMSNVLKVSLQTTIHSLHDRGDPQHRAREYACLMLWLRLARHNLFSADEYLRRRQSRSILCLPLLKQGELIGVLYLENSLTANVFTPDRLAVLGLLASQAAISLENARL